MKIKVLIALFSLIVLVKGNWWAAAVNPVILGFGAAFAANEIEVEPHLMPFKRLKYPKSW